MSRGIEVLGRVREIRERDSLIGLQRSKVLLAEQQRLASQEETRHRALPVAREGAVDGFLVHRAGLSRSAHVLQRRQVAAHDSGVVAEEARRRWQADRVRLRTIERLVERRAETARLDLLRREVREQDEVAEQMHQRRTDPRRGEQA